MFRLITCCTILVITLLFNGPAIATDYYIANSACMGATPCTPDGASCAKAYVAAYPNATWGWAGVKGDDTVYICGTVELSKSSQILVGASGSSGHPVTLKFCKDGEANCGTGNPGLVTAPVSGNMIAVQGGVHDVVIDGNGVGVVQCTDSGSGLLGYTYHAPDVGYATGIFVDGGYNIEIKNLTLRDFYVHKYQTDSFDGRPATGAVGIQVRDTQNIYIHDNTISDGFSGITHINTGNRTESTVRVFNNNVKHCCWGIQADLGTAGGVTNDVQVFNNEIEMGANWMSKGGNDCHINGSYFYSGVSPNPSSASLTNLQYYNNYIHGPFEYWSNFPTGSTYGCTAFFHYDYGSGSGNAAFNNLIVAGPHILDGNPSNGFMSWADVETNPKFFNNTMIGPASGCLGGGGNEGSASSPDMRNNICLNATRFYGGLYTPESDYNNIAISGSTASIMSITYNTLSDWQSKLGGGCPGASGNDCNSITSNPKLDSKYKPTGAPLARSGQNLTTYCSSYPALCFDKDGNTRPSTGPWDIGAYQYTGVLSGVTGLHLIK